MKNNKTLLLIYAVIFYVYTCDIGLLKAIELENINIYIDSDLIEKNQLHLTDYLIEQASVKSAIQRKKHIKRIFYGSLLTWYGLWLFNSLKLNIKKDFFLLDKQVLNNYFFAHSKTKIEEEQPNTLVLGIAGLSLAWGLFLLKSGFSRILQVKQNYVNALAFKANG